MQWECEILGVISSFGKLISCFWCWMLRSIMSGIFGGRDPFDDPFFNRPFGSLFGSTAPRRDPSSDNRSKGPVIEELDSDDEQMLGDEEDNSGNGEKSDKYQENILSNKNPLVEHPEDQTDDQNKSISQSKEMSYRNNHGKAEGKGTQERGVSFQRVTCGGINGAYYTASTTRRTGSDGVVLEESKHADRTTGQATHRISRGVHDKGHSVTRKLDGDGKVETEQTFHNLDEDELASFEQTWKGNADRHLPGWGDGHANFGPSSSGLTTWSGWTFPFGADSGGDAGLRGSSNAQAYSARGRPKKVVTIPIE